jgi:hypothetical protein
MLKQCWNSFAPTGAVRKATKRAVGAGLLLKPDADRLVRQAEASRELRRWSAQAAPARLTVRDPCG